MRQAKLLDLHVRKGALSHAYLFSGPRGSLKAAVRDIFVASLLCQKRPRGVLASCGHCTSCEMIARGTHPDIVRLSSLDTQNKSTHITLEDVRYLRGRAAQSASAGRWQVFIVDDAAAISREASPALLKTVEEPPGHALFILVTETFSSIPATLVSRSWHVPFALSPDEISCMLQEVLRKKSVMDLVVARPVARFAAYQSVYEDPERLRLWYDEQITALYALFRTSLTGTAGDIGETARRLRTLLTYKEWGEKTYTNTRLLFEASSII